MSTPALRPPLPAPLSHDGIAFALDTGAAGSGRLSDQILVAIASSLQAILPAGDLTVDQNGAVVSLESAASSTWSASLWYQSGLLAGIERSRL